MTGAAIAGVDAGSPALTSGLRPGDKIVAINGKRLRDIIDYQMACTTAELTLSIERSGRSLQVDMRQDFSVPLGITLEQPVFNGVRRCCNDCVFCFVDQMPPGVRPSLAMKDDDYRLSFLYGNFVTLTNLTQSSLERIIEDKLTPLYVSIHSAESKVRSGLMRPRRRDNALRNLETLLASGIEAHAQVVVCPDWNDGKHLSATIGYLAGLSGILSIGLVPVGLTGYREGLTDLRSFTPDEAGRLLEEVSNLQAALKARRGSRTVFAADEFYLLSGVPLPDDEVYEDYPQVENGIGISRSFIDESMREMDALGPFPESPKSLTAITSTLAADVVARVCAGIAERGGPRVDILAVPSTFLGGHVSVAGLIAGREVIEAAKELEGEILLPDICLNEEGLFVDGLRLDEVNRACDGRLRVVPSDGARFVRSLWAEAA